MIKRVFSSIPVRKYIKYWIIGVIFFAICYGLFGGVLTAADPDARSGVGFLLKFQFINAILLPFSGTFLENLRYRLFNNNSLIYGVWYFWLIAVIIKYFLLYLFGPIFGVIELIILFCQAKR